MTEGKRFFNIPEQQIAYLRVSGILADALPNIFGSASADSEKTRGLWMSRDDAEQARSILTDHLARVGFDAEYGVTAEGRVLEELIDHFYW